MPIQNENHAILKEQMLSLFKSGETLELTDIYSRLGRTVGDNDTRRVLWQLLNAGFLHMTLQRKYTKGEFYAHPEREPAPDQAGLAGEV